MKIPKELHKKILSEAKIPLKIEGITKETANTNTEYVKIVGIPKEILKEKTGGIQKENTKEILKKKGIQQQILKNIGGIRKENTKKENAETECLGMGIYDENQSHNYFLEALNEYRALKKPEKAENNEENVISTDKNIEKTGKNHEKNENFENLEKSLEKTDKKSAFFYNIGENWHNTYMDQTSGNENAVITKKNLKICWECMKSFEETSFFHNYKEKVIKNVFFLIKSLKFQGFL